jgi:hypothetical protein
MTQFLQMAERLGTPQLLLWESDTIGRPPASGPTVQAMNGYAHR